MTGADPVRELLHAHRELCEQAVDVLDIAAGLEDAGIGPESAARYRHADVFGLAEELHARVPHRPGAPGGPPPAVRRRTRAADATRSALLHLVPVAVLALAAGHPAAPALATAAGTAALTTLDHPRRRPNPAGARHGGARPQGSSPAGRERPPAGRVVRPSGAWAGAGWSRLWAAVGVSVVLVVVARGSVGFGVAAAVGAGAARWWVGWARGVGRVQVGSAVTIAEFGARMRPVLPVAVLAQVVLAAVLVAAPRGGADAAVWAGQGALAVLLLLAGVVRVCGRPAVAAVGVLVAAAGVVLVVLRGDPALAVPAGCAVPVAVLLPYAWLLLGRPGSHRPGPPA
ncbi:hypothetical protein ACGFX4_00535 [Kitasatospora sp. NPDC048365]|uniref:hypothetical protein n=1 Tax=Kitasatospora sp. NPDC048365 TaxID=3364050 RepID=UPI0037178DDD